jgi:6-phosphogluconolactonase
VGGDSREVRAMPPTDHFDPSRREFVASSALGLLGIAALTTRQRVPNDAALLYVGCYTDAGHANGIHLVRFDTRSGQLERSTSVNAGANPSFLAVHPNGSVLYAVNEAAEHDGRPTGGVSAFAIAEDGALTRVGEQSSEGRGPCYVSVDRSGRVVLVANYDEGSVALLPINAGGAVGAATSVDQHQGKGPNAERQEAPHAHCIVTDRSNRYALAADLGIDRVLMYGLNVQEGTLQRIERGDATLRPGAGPRHIAFHRRFPLVYVVNELDSTITRLRLDVEAGMLTPLDTISTLPAGWTGTSYAADIHVAPSGNVLYVSNRGHNGIAVFSIATDGALALRQTILTGGDWPRNFSIDPTGRWLIVANQHSGTIVVFARDASTGRLTPTRQRMELANPACLRFRAHVGVTA